MWRRVTVHATLDQPVERVFAYLAEPTLWHEFVPAVVHRRPMGTGPVEVGSRWQATDRIGPFRIHFIDELAEIDEPRRIVWLSSSPWNARTEYELETADRETRITARYEGDIAGWLRTLAWIPGPVVASILAQDFKRLQRLLASTTQPADS